MRKSYRYAVAISVLAFGAIAVYLFVGHKGIADGYQVVENKAADAEWTWYRDESFGFRIAYPSRLKPVILDPTEANPRLAPGLQMIEGVIFTDVGPGVMGVKTYSLPENFSLLEWLRSQQDRLQQEGGRTISGKEAFVAHLRGGEEAFPNEKRAYLVTDKYVFEIMTSFYSDESQHVVVWDSFELESDGDRSI